MAIQNGIIFRGKELRLARIADDEKNDTCYRCALKMYECNGLCMTFGLMLGYTRATSSRMYFIKPLKL